MGKLFKSFISLSPIIQGLCLAFALACPSRVGPLCLGLVDFSLSKRVHVVFASSPLEGHSCRVFNPHYKQPCIFLAYEIYEIVCPSKTLSFLSSLRVKPT